MNLIDLEKCTRNEEVARRYLLDHCFRQSAPACPRCGDLHLYHLSDGRRRCRQCRYTFSEFAGRWLNIGGLRCAEWLLLLRSFAEGASVQETQRRLGVVYTTTHKAFHTVRCAIVAHAADRERLFPVIMAPRAQGEQMARGMVFGITEGPEGLGMRLLEGVRIADVLGLPVPRMQVGQIVYTGPFKQYMGSGFWLDRHIKPTAKSVLLWHKYDAIWRFRARRRRLSAWQYIFHVKEMEFRLNHGVRDGFAKLADYLCDLVPGGTESLSAETDRGTRQP